MKKGHLAKRRQASSALVITLLGVVLLTIIVVAFMQAMSMSLTTAKSYADIRRATMVARAGLDTAIAQITWATGTNLAFVTGQTNYPLANFPLTVIGAGNLTNLSQMMPLVSGPMAYLTNFGTTNGAASFSNNFNTYASFRTNDPTQTVDVNVYTNNNANPPYPFIQDINDTNMYRASWVTMTNVVGSQVSYTRFAYVVLDDSARINPTLMTGAGTGYTNSTNWYSGPQDINAAYLSNSGAQVLSASQMAALTNATTSNAFGYSDATLGYTPFANRAAYEAVKNLFTSRTNASFDVIPAWYPDGGKPKYNINDLATNTAYGATPLARASNIASIITNNLPNFYLRDAALSTVGTNNTPGTVDKTLYVTRLAADIVDYICPDGTWGATDYSTNMSGVSPQGHGVYPVEIDEMSYVTAGAGTSTTKYTNSTIVNQFWISVWNPYTTPVTINSASISITDRPGYSLGGAAINTMQDYTNPVSVISGSASVSGSPPYVVKPNEFVVMGFVPQTNIINGASTANGPTRVSGAPYEQYALTINGQTTAQSGAMNPHRSTPNISGGVQTYGAMLTTNYDWNTDGIAVYMTEVGDPRFESYYNEVWNSYDNEYTNGGAYWKGIDNVGRDDAWGGYVFPALNAFGVAAPISSWANRDNIARSPANVGSIAANNQTTPDALADKYTSTDSNAAPEVIRNGPMVSIGELGQVFDPAYANDILNAVAPRADAPTSFTNAYSNGGGRSLRIGRPEANGTNYVGGQPYAPGNWDVNGERAISLLDLFTINNTNLVNGNATNALANAANLTSGGAQGRINPNTASSNVLASMFVGMQITADSGLTNSSGLYPVLTNSVYLASNVIANRPYSSLSDLYTNMPLFDSSTNYYPNLPMTTALNHWNWGNGSTTFSYYPSTLNVFNRVHQEAFGKWVQHLTVQSRSYRIYVIGQVLDKSQNPRGSVVMEAGIYLQMDPTGVRYEPVIQYVRFLK